jgi:hypothetical protein
MRGILPLLLGLAVTAFSQGSSAARMPLVLNIPAHESLNGTAGDYVTVHCDVSNLGKVVLTDVTTYLSLVDNASKMPVDLEDWSAERGLFIGTIAPGQTFPLDWKIHFVKAGDYSLIVVATGSGSELPETSQIVRFRVNPKRNLEAAKVLPVALGEPVLLIFLMALVVFLRNRRIAA